MKQAARQYRLFLLLSFLSLLIATNAAAGTQLVLKHGGQNEHSGEYTGVLELVIDPGVENAKVNVTVDGQRVADGLRAPYRIVADFGPTAVQHRITVQVFNANNKRVKQWHETINHGLLPLSVRVQPLDLGARLFEAITTSPKEDPVEVVQLWHNGNILASAKSAPYRFTIPEEVLAADFVQITARTKGGEEAADFWSAAGNVYSQELQIRTVPIFVSVVDRNGQAHDKLERSSFRILDNEAEGKIVEFGKAFDQPISIALLVDSSASMTYSMQHAAKAAAEFVQRALKDGDRCSVTAIQDVPRRKQALTNDRAAIAKALVNIKPAGQTALFDAISTAVRELREEKNRRAIVLLTDGGDTSSITTYEEIQKLAREAGIPLYFIAYEGIDRDQLRHLDRLRFLAAETGGFVATATQQNLMARYEAIEKDLRAQFAIKYQVSDLGRSNEWRRVRVVIDSPKLTARTIKGYFTP